MDLFLVMMLRSQNYKNNAKVAINRFSLKKTIPLKWRKYSLQPCIDPHMQYKELMDVIPQHNW